MVTVDSKYPSLRASTPNNNNNNNEPIIIFIYIKYIIVIKIIAMIIILREILTLWSIVRAKHVILEAIRIKKYQVM